MVLTIIETVSVLAVVIGAIIAVFGAPSSGTLAFAEARVILLIIGPLGRCLRPGLSRRHRP
jgi:hypothetical protein